MVSSAFLFGNTNSLWMTVGAQGAKVSMVDATDVKNVEAAITPQTRLVFVETIANPRTDWCYSTTSDPGLNGRSLGYARGRVLGGCSSINAMIYMRGQREDYDGWVAEGAKYEAHWAFAPTERAPLPAVKLKAWPRNAIDHFILARLEQAKLAPAPSATADALLRRVSFGVTGLPPAAEVATSFRTRPDDANYSSVLNELLASTQHGEHWARHWMDIWRYSDAWGLGDQLRNSQRHIWHWRDWIVESLNADRDRKSVV